MGRIRWAHSWTWNPPRSPRFGGGARAPKKVGRRGGDERETSRDTRNAPNSLYAIASCKDAMLGDSVAGRPFDRCSAMRHGHCRRAPGSENPRNCFPASAWRTRLRGGRHEGDTRADQSGRVAVARTSSEKVGHPRHLVHEDLVAYEGEYAIVDVARCVRRTRFVSSSRSDTRDPGSRPRPEIGTLKGSSANYRSFFRTS